MAETLVEALDKMVAALPFNCPEGVCLVCLKRQAEVRDSLLPILAAHASPEVKRVLLRQLLGERLEEMADPEGVVTIYVRDSSVLGCPVSTRLRRGNLLESLAPSPAPMEGRSNGN